MSFFFFFLDFIGAVFPPMMVICLTDFYLIHKGNYKYEDVDREGGAYWYRGGFNPAAIAVWVVGAVIYYVCNNYLNIGFSKVIISMGSVFILYMLVQKLGAGRRAA